MVIRVLNLGTHFWQWIIGFAGLRLADCPRYEFPTNCQHHMLMSHLSHICKVCAATVFEYLTKAITYQVLMHHL